MFLLGYVSVHNIVDVYLLVYELSVEVGSLLEAHLRDEMVKHALLKLYLSVLELALEHLFRKHSVLHLQLLQRKAYL